MTRDIKLDYPINPKVRTPSKYVQDLFFSPEVIKQTEFTLKAMEDLSEFIPTIAEKADGTVTIKPRWCNGWFSGYDALSLCAILAEKKPDIYFEIGSGNSTKFANAVINHFDLPTRIISVDPDPRTEIDSICDKIYRQPCESLDLCVFDCLTENSVLFMDGSHRCFQNSDVTAFFLDILPSLPIGITWGIHDIMLPHDYPKGWKTRYYSEQYMLAAYMLGGGGSDKLIYNFKTLSHDPDTKATLSTVFDCHPKGDMIKKKRGSACWFKRG